MPQGDGGDELRSLFLDEAQELLDTISEGTLDLEGSDAGGEGMTVLFRAAHTLKGAAAVVGYEPVQRVAHSLEDLFDDLRSGRRAADRATIDAILGCADSMRSLVMALARGEEGVVEATAAEEALARAGSGSDYAQGPGAAAPAERPAGREAPTGPQGPAPAEGPAGPEEPAPAEEPTGTDAPELEPPRPRPPVEPEGSYVRMPLERANAIGRLANEAMATGMAVGRELAGQLEEDADALQAHAELDRTLTALRREALKARMTTFGTVAGPLRRAARDVALHEGKQVRWALTGEGVELDRRVLDALRDPLLHLVRNAVAHGLETPADRIARGKPEEGEVAVIAEARGAEVRIVVRDDGRGIDLDAIRAQSEQAGLSGDPLELIFSAGFSTSPEVSDASGRGVGLDVVRAAAETVQGRVEVQSEPGRGAGFVISVPITLAVLPCLVALTAGQPYAIPLHAAERILDVPPEEEEIVEGRHTLPLEGRLVEVCSLAEVLGRGNGSSGPAVVVASGAAKHAFRVDELVDRRDVVVKDLGPLVPRIDVLAGAAVQGDGSLMLVLHPAGLVARGPTVAAAGGARAMRAPAADAPPPARILVVDDAMTVRELQRSILERAGYEVETAVDGADAMARLAAADFDLVLADVEMPRMDGFELIETIRERPQLAGLPVIIITSKEDERDRRRGLEAGADSYIVKRAFEERALLDVVERMLGKDR